MPVNPRMHHWSLFLLLLPSCQPSSPPSVSYLGSFTQHQHNVQGLLASLGPSHLVITEFHYDGLGPAVYFLVGSWGPPGPHGTILSYPGEGRAYSYTDPRASSLQRAYTNETVMLELPPGLSTEAVAWVSVWCRVFSQSFGEVLVEGQGGQVEGQGRHVEGQGGHVEGQGGQVEEQGGSGKVDKVFLEY